MTRALIVHSETYRRTTNVNKLLELWNLLIVVFATLNAVNKPQKDSF